MALCSWGSGTWTKGCGRAQPVAGRMSSVGRSWVWMRVRQRVPLLLFRAAASPALASRAEAFLS